MQESVAVACHPNTPLIIVIDDSCPLVQKLGWLIRRWDSGHAFSFIGSRTDDVNAKQLVDKLSESDWSLMLIDKEGNCFLGPEAIPFILKNLPSGKLAAVTYTIPGTMWLTRQAYRMVSRHRRLLSRSKEPGELKTA